MRCRRAVDAVVEIGSLIRQNRFPYWDPGVPDPLGRSDLLGIARRSGSVGEAVSAIEPRVREWVWTRASSDRWWLEPLFLERLGQLPGEDLARRPRRLRQTEEYGYDEAGRLPLARRYVDETTYETLVVEHEHDVAIVRTYASDVTAALTRVVRTVFEGDRVVLAEHAGPGVNWFYWLERLEYDAEGRLRTVEFERTDVELRIAGAPSVGRGVQRLAYDDAHELVGIVEEYASGWPPRVIRA